MENQNEQRNKEKVEQKTKKSSAWRVWGWILICLPLLGIYSQEKLQRFLNNPIGEWFPSVMGIFGFLAINPIIWFGLFCHCRADKKSGIERGLNWRKITIGYVIFAIIIIAIFAAFIFIPQIIGKAN